MSMVDDGGTVKVYLFRAAGHGPTTYGVMAASEEEARTAIADHIKQDPNVRRHDFMPWPNNHELEIYEPGQVFENENE